MRPQQQSPKLRNILEEHRPLWDNDRVRPSARRAIQKALRCRTLELGANVYRSASGESRTVPHTCKSRACPSCGHMQTLRWLDEVDPRLPDVPYSSLIFTMPKEFWPIFQKARHLLYALPAIAASVILDWAQKRYHAVVPVLIVPHTFNPKLEFNVHLHVLAGQTGITRDGGRAVRRVFWPVDVLRTGWRKALLDFLADALENGALPSCQGQAALARLIEEHRTRWWKVSVQECVKKKQAVRYIARYLRRPPLAEYRLRPSDGPSCVCFVWNDKRNKNHPEVLKLPVEEFLQRFVDQVPDRYQHGVNFFGLLAPRSRPLYECLLHCIGARLPHRPRRRRWAASLRACFGIDPLRDFLGLPMHFSHRLPPLPTGLSRAP